LQTTKLKKIMAVSIDTVYQRVLALANKEQRGYITPQEFNLFANQAQMEIFEQYFYDVNKVNRQPGNNTDYSDALTMLDEKMQIFEAFASVPFTPIIGPLGSYNISTTIDDIYRLGMITYFDANVSSSPIIFEKVTEKDFWEIQKLPLTKPNAKRPIYANTSGGILSVYASVNPSSITVNYIRKPKNVNWAYVIVNDKALYNDNIAVDFELHPSEETELVYKILKLSGISLKAAEVVQVAQTLEQTQVQQEKQ
jgi:hypothetical protein